MQVHLDNLQAQFDYHDLDLIFNFMAAILFVVDMIYTQYLKKQLA